MKTKHLLIYALVVFGLIALNSQCKKSTTPMEVESSITENSNRKVGPVIKLDSLKDSCFTDTIIFLDTATCNFVVKCGGDTIKDIQAEIEATMQGKGCGTMSWPIDKKNRKKMDSIVKSYNDCNASIIDKLFFEKREYKLDSTVRTRETWVPRWTPATCFNHYSKTVFYNLRILVKVCCPKKSGTVKGKPNIKQAPPVTR